MGVPAVVGVRGVERIVEIQLSPSEQEAFQKSVNAVKTLVGTMDRLMAEQPKAE